MRVVPLSIGILAMAAALAGNAFASERTPAGSYLVYRATTVSDLRAEVASNPLVQSRFTKHFGRSADFIDKYFAQLKLVALKKPLKTQCWYIDRNGAICVKTKLLPRGAMVFATKDGTPLMSWSCGNPLRAELPLKVAVKADKQSVGSSMSGNTQTAESLSPREGEQKVLSNPMQIVTNAVFNSPPAPALVSALPVEAPPVIGTIAAPAVSMPPVIAAAGGLNMGWLGALGAAGGVAAGMSGGGGNNPPVAPEPSSLIILASALGTLSSICGVKRRKR